MIRLGLICVSTCHVQEASVICVRRQLPNIKTMIGEELNLSLAHTRREFAFKDWNAAPRIERTNLTPKT